MSWIEEQRCPNCGARIGRKVKVTFNFSNVLNLKKKCSGCNKYGCLQCMEGSLKSGIFFHKNCNPLLREKDGCFPR